MNHLGGVKAQFFFQLTASQFLGIDVAHLPSTLRQFQTTLLNGVAELLNQPDAILLDGDNDGAIFFVDYPVYALLAIGTEDLILTHGKPGIAIDFSTGKRRYAFRRLIGG